MKALRWRCRRGMRELDLLLIGFLDARYAAASPEEQEAFAQLLDLPDPEIARYLLGHEQPPDISQRELVQHIAACRR